MEDVYMSDVKRQWIIVSAILVVTFTLMGSVALADDTVSFQPSHPHYKLVKKRARMAGFDITTVKGRKGYKRYLRLKHTQKAAELGFDITTPAGKKAYRQYRKDHAGDK